eukprot:SAG31_NODE_735_length_12488_cov_7.086044_11_plen_121_part_00
MDPLHSPGGGVSGSPVHLGTDDADVEAVTAAVTPTAVHGHAVFPAVAFPELLETVGELVHVPVLNSGQLSHRRRARSATASEQLVRGDTRQLSPSIAACDAWRGQRWDPAAWPPAARNLS